MRAAYRFFDGRKAHARALGLGYATFCAVIRPEDHPMRPAGDSPLDAFRTRRGYGRADGLVGRFSWTDIGAEVETDKPTRALWRLRPIS